MRLTSFDFFQGSQVASKKGGRNPAIHHLGCIKPPVNNAMNGAAINYPYNWCGIWKKFP